MTSVRQAIGGLLASRRSLCLVGATWVAALALTAALRADVAVLLLVTLLGLQVLTFLNAHRQSRHLVADPRRRLDDAHSATLDELRRLANTIATRDDAERLGNQLAALSDTLAAASTAIGRGPENTRRLVVKDTTAAYRQLEALFNLYSMVPVGARVPAMRGWAASPDLLLVLVESVRVDRPRLTVECGSGVSTLWCALARRTFGVEGRHVALEHDERYVRQTRALLDAHGVAPFAEVRHAPLETFHLGEQQWPWYGRNAWRDLEEIDQLFVDGPPGVVAEHARYPAVPLLADRLARGATVVLDDVIRTDEQELVARWLADYPWLSETRLDVEKVASVLRGSAG